MMGNKIIKGISVFQLGSIKVIGIIIKESFYCFYYSPIMYFLAPHTHDHYRWWIEFSTTIARVDLSKVSIPDELSCPLQYFIHFIVMASISEWALVNSPYKFIQKMPKTERIIVSTWNLYQIFSLIRVNYGENLSKFEQTDPELELVVSRILLKIDEIGQALLRYRPLSEQ